MSLIKGNRVGLPLLAVAGSVCWECKEANNNGTSLSRCKGCKRAVYCSSECQKRNWVSEHSTLCKLLRQINAGSKAHGQLTWDEFKALQFQRCSMIMETLKDKDSYKPGAMSHIRAVQFQPKCETCLRTPFDHVDTETFRLTSCEDCKLAFFCSPKCRTEGLEKHRNKQCSSLEDAGACELILVDHFKATGEATIQLPSEKPRYTYRPLQTVRNWKDYFEDVSKSPFGKSITKGFSAAKNDKLSSQTCRFLKVAVDSSSLILTILASLESEIPGIASRTKLTIHILGADGEEIERGLMMEEVYHLLPNLKSLVVGYVGPDVGHPYGDTKKLLEPESCHECQKIGRYPRQAFLANDLYHDFVRSGLFAKYPPDLVVAPHSGHAEEEVQRWRPTLQCVLDLGVPAAFTTYNKKEALDEERIFSNMGAHFTKRPAENPWRGVFPKFDTFMERYDIYYFNYYWYIVKGKSRG